jgi:tetratricopeptide (TPR) repeat protein
LLKKGKLNEAIEEYRRLLSVESKNPNLYNELGDIFLRTGDRIQAISCFEKAAAHYEQVALYNNAVAVCKKILRVVPNRIDTIFKLGELRSKQKFDGEAANYFSQYLTCVLSDPQSVAEGVSDKVQHILELCPNEDIISSASDVYGHVGLHYHSAELLARLIARGASEIDANRLALYRNRFEMIKSKLSPEELEEFESMIEREGGAEVREVVEEAKDESEIIEAIDSAGQAPEASFEPPPDEVGEAGGESADEAAAAAAAVKAAETVIIEQGIDSSAPAQGPLPEETPAQGPLPDQVPAQEPPSPPEQAAAEAEYAPDSQVAAAADSASSSEAEIATGDDIATALEDHEAFEAGAEPSVIGPAEAAAASGSSEESSVEPAGASTPPGGANQKLADEITSDIEEDDFKSHYDLGMAYIEMALLDEAVKELQIAARSSQLKLKSLEMIGHCFLQQSKPRLAVKQLNRGLEMAEDGDADCLGIHYNLGLSYEMLGDMEKAREHFEEVYIIDVTFRDVAEKMKKFSASS